MAVSTTRLLILGAVRIFQPVHGYFVRRELLTWRAEEWAHLNPGSVYNALRGLERDGFLEEVASGEASGAPARTSYCLTADGETEFFTLLRAAMWHVEPFAPDQLLAAASFMWALSRDEVSAALEHRVAHIDSAHRALDFAVREILHVEDKPPHVAEVLRLGHARMRGEREWAATLLERVRAGELSFAGEEPAWTPAHARRSGEAAG